MQSPADHIGYLVYLTPALDWDAAVARCSADSRTRPMCPLSQGVLALPPYGRRDHRYDIGPPGHGTRRPDVAWPSAYRPLNSCRQTSGVTWWLGCWPTPARHRETANDENPNAAPPRG
jgi:hypothetical protein